ncbi:MAG: Eco57I restriction-modification methylase domain-containing protein [Chitinophagaceae bacterium]|nr:Eco57I restriction-modification methylase domain-containing protein [Chitinophagaceae bacterium]
MDIRTLKSHLSQPYQRNQWMQLLPTIFGQQIQIDSRAEKIALSGSKVKSIERFASISLAGDKNIAVLDIETNESIQIERNRVALRDMVYRLIDQDRYHGLLVFYYNNERKKSSTYRMSLVSKETLFDDSGNIVEKSTHPKRYTYILGAGETRTTTAQRLLELKAKQNTSKSKGIALKDVTDAFSVSNLTKEFYNELFRWYQWALTEEIGITFPQTPNTPDHDQEKLEEQIIRLITRLLFIWFIKQKQLVPDSLFDTKELENILNDFNPQSNIEGNYYNAILQNLFFATLNKAIDERGFAKTKTIRDIKTLYRYTEMFSIPEEDVIKLFKPIPFLNGGLFECLDKEDAEGNKYLLDGFSRNNKRNANGNFKHRAFIPNSVFFHEEKGIIPLLQRYNFTVEEHAPEDVQVALDPELLGNVFENLLGAFNNETKETARKQSGSFYTPREIVDYMVDESLIAYLQNACPYVSSKDIRFLLEKAELPDNFKNNEKLCADISKRLKSIKIIDPACGSGAFPMGILKKMVAVLEKLDIKDKETTYDQKLHLIEECIYGVDIQTIAAQISKLRFFISLIVEQDKDEAKSNYGITPLPNLETKFVAANTLIGKKKKPAQLTIFENGAIDAVKEELLEIRKAHFYAKSASEKKRLREKDDELRNQLSKLLEDSDQYAHGDAVELAQWNPYNQNETAVFFDVEWMFGLKGGFDVVIGNPPYIQLQQNGGVLAKIYERSGYKTFDRRGDIYSLFYEKGWHLLKPKGVLCYITSNGWMRNDYGKNTRSFFAEQADPILLIDFAGQKVFESATVEVNILMFAKDKNRQQTKACIVKEKLLKNLSDFIRQNANHLVFITSDSWVVLSPIEQRIKEKIERIGIPLKDWDIQINYGIKTGFNEAFIIDGAKRKELIDQDPKSEEIIRPILRGKDIKRYAYDFADKWLINTHNGIKEKGIKPVNVDDYPAIKKHLDSYYPELVKRADKGDTPYNLRNCAYIDDFSKQKIIWGEISDKTKFCIDLSEDFTTEATTFLMTGQSLLYLLGFLNSKLSEYLFSKIGTTTGVGTIRWKKYTIEKLRVPAIPYRRQLEYDTVVSEIVERQKNKNGYSDLAKKLDSLIYQDVQLAEEEIKFIENQ